MSDDHPPYWTRDQTLVLESLNQAISLRGLFIQRYAGVEAAISHLLAFAYAAQIATTWNKSHGGRVKTLTALLRQPGPLSTYRAELYAALDGFVEYDRPRHFLAHGIMTADYRATQPAVRISMYEWTGDQQLSRAEMAMPLQILQQLTDELHAYSAVVPGLVARISREVGFPSM